MRRSPLARLQTLRFVVEGWEVQGERRQVEQRVWYEAPSRVRCEARVGPYTHLVVSDGRRRWWSYDPSEMRVDDESADYASAADIAGSVVDPSGLLPRLEIEGIDETTLLGRPADVVRAKARGEELEEGDRFALVIDRESGLILRKDAWVDDVQSGHAEVVELAIDEPIPEHVFSYTPPPGVRLRDHGELEREFAALPRTLEESAPLMPFEVFVPADGYGWTLVEARPSLEHDESGLGRHLAILYSRGPEELHVWEWALEPGERQREKMELERGAGPFVVMELGGPDREGASVVVTIRGTRVQLLSFALAEDELVALAPRLVPFGSGQSSR